MNAERDVVEARKAQAIKDLVEVERRRQAGEIDAETAEHLKKIYEAEVVAALEPEPVSVASPRHLSLGRWDRMTGAMTLAGIGVKYSATRSPPPFATTRSISSEHKRRAYGSSAT